MIFKRILLFSLILVLLGAGLAAGLVGAGSNDTPERALPLTSPTFGALTGSQGGAFAFYKFDYPGKNWVAKLTPNFSPDDAVVHSAIGLIVYAPNGAAYTSSITNTLGLQQIRFASSLAGSYLLQVYNYIPGHTINYSVTTQGIPIPAAPAPTPSASVCGLALNTNSKRCRIAR